MKNIAYIISNIHKSVGFEWLAMNLDKKKYNLSFILINSEETLLEKFLIEQNFKTFRVTYRGKKDLLSSLISVYKILKNQSADIVHTHLFEANFIGLLCAKFAGIKQRIHTRHHAMLHHDYFSKGVYYDKFINSLSTHIVTPSLNVKEILVQKEFVNENKVKIIYHGFDLISFEVKNAKRINDLKIKYLSEDNYPVVGVISRYTNWKGVQYIIPAFRELLSQYPNALLLLANAKGDYSSEIKKMLQSLPENSYYEIEFEPDIFSLYHLFDFFVHVPINSRAEAFGQTYVEALAAGIPSVFTLSGIASEFIVDKKNALVVNYKNSGEITFALKQLLENPYLRDGLIEQGKISVSQYFQLSKMINSLENLYDR